MGHPNGGAHIQNGKLFNRVGLGRKGRIAPVSAILANIDLMYLAARNQRIRSTLKRLQNVVIAAKGFKAIECSPRAELGGFHYGMPFWCHEDLLEDVEKQLLKRKINLLRPPFPAYRSLPLLSNSSKFRDAIYTVGHPQKLQTGIVGERELQSEVTKENHVLRFLPLSLIDLRPKLHLEFSQAIQASERR